MSRSSNINLIVRDNRVELLLRFSEIGYVVKNDFRFLMLLCTLGDTNFDGVDNSQCTVAVVDYFYSVVHTGDNDGGHIRSAIAINGRRATAPYEQPTFDGHVIERDFAICCAAADNQIAVHGHILEHHIVGTNENAALDVLIVGSLRHNVSADDVVEDLRKFGSCDIVQRFQTFGSAVNVIRANHCPDVGQRPG